MDEINDAQFVDQVPGKAIRRSVPTLDQWVDEQVREGRGTPEFRFWLHNYKNKRQGLEYVKVTPYAP